LIVNQKTHEVIATTFADGSQHDFAVFKRSHYLISKHIRSLADSGYMGLSHLHANCQLPIKKPRRHRLTKEQQESNWRLSHERVLIENVIRKLKIFRILSERYRNRRKRFCLRFNLIAAIYNLELKNTP
jgi:hypothetical protein